MPAADLTLPPKAPSIAQFHTQRVALPPFALYTLVPLPPSTLDTIISTCNASYGEEHSNSLRLPPVHYFAGRSLRDVFEHHLKISEDLSWEPVWFVVVVDEEWEENGVLVVALDDERCECDVHSLFMRAGDVTESLVGLQIDTLDWGDVERGAVSQV